MGTGRWGTRESKKLARDIALAIQLPGFVSFDNDEVRRIEDAELMLLGIQPSELVAMSLQQRVDLLEVHRAKQNPKEYIQN